MGIENFGKVAFTTETKAAEFVSYLEKGQVMATKCKKCGTVTFPPKMDCPSCMSSEVEWVEVTKPGKLATYTLVTYGPTGFEDDQPYTLGLADFGDFKMFGRICPDLAKTPAEIKVGMAVKVAATKLANGHVAYEFQKA